ncbi:MAG: 4Fe-4S binding protein, partial [bacterium]|nr:4Fe-4S binding protein [bacterium]
LIKNSAKWKSIPVLHRVLFTFGTSKTVWKYISEKACLDTEKSKCTKCGLCAKLCPVHNIEMKGFPVFLKKCQLCMRCISFCPSGAILKDGKEIKPYKAVEVSALI